ncbi:hypothetical protein WJX75_006651 [Coccomyxa subellipsoidea]|uniref:IGFBP N-terminal domain-containing protein n=1 Tax=Coccomyxa subellipsoidea TaxID=248742 RepID=A0ABR2YE97_9CHLO
MGLRYRASSVSMAIVLVLSTLILHTVSQSDAAANDNALMKDISGAQQAAFDAVTAGGAGNENILEAVKFVEGAASPVSILPTTYGPAYSPAYGKLPLTSPSAYSSGNPQPPAYAPQLAANVESSGACNLPLKLNQVSQCCPAGSCLTVSGACGSATAPTCGIVGGTCIPTEENTTCSDTLGIYLAVINGKCNGKGGRAATDKAQVAMLCAPGSAQQPQCTSEPDRFLTCSADVTLTKQKGREFRVQATKQHHAVHVSFPVYVFKVAPVTS